LGLITRALPRFLEESFKKDGFHIIKNYLPLINASWACPEDYLLSFYFFDYHKLIIFLFPALSICVTRFVFSFILVSTFTFPILGGQSVFDRNACLNVA
jgi:hypothetical protein